MQILVNSDHTVDTPKGFKAYVRRVIEKALEHHDAQITRIEVHFADENGDKTGANDKRCVMEARLAGRKPIAVTEHADTLDEVISGAAEKLKHALLSILGKEHNHHPRISGHGGIFKNEDPMLDPADADVVDPLAPITYAKW